MLNHKSPMCWGLQHAGTSNVLRCWMSSDDSLSSTTSSVFITSMSGWRRSIHMQRPTLNTSASPKSRRALLAPCGKDVPYNPIMVPRRRQGHVAPLGSRIFAVAKVVVVRSISWHFVDVLEAIILWSTVVPRASLCSRLIPSRLQSALSRNC
jgi:hypothetical protein